MLGGEGECQQLTSIHPSLYKTALELLSILMKHEVVFLKEAPIECLSPEDLAHRKGRSS